MNDREGKTVPDARAAGLVGEVADEALVERARAKDEAAFEELVNRYENKLYRLAMRFVRNETDAQEILQDAFLSAWRNLPSFEGRAQFGSWMYRVTVNAALMLLGSRNRHPEVTVGDVEPTVLNDALAESGQTMRANVDSSPHGGDTCRGVWRSTAVPARAEGARGLRAAGQGRRPDRKTRRNGGIR